MPIIVSLYDISKFFDRENLKDAMDALNSCGITGKLYRLLFMMNKDTVIQVKTGVGLSEKANTGENVGQGTIDGAIVSSTSIAKGVNEVFSLSNTEISYGGESLQPLLFQDDVLRASLSIKSLMIGNQLIEEVIESKLLDLNISKCSFIVIGNKKYRDKLEKDLRGQQIKLCGKRINSVESEKWLGEFLHTDGNSQSIITTVKKRYGVVMSTIMDVKSIVDDKRSNSIGGLRVGLDVFELSIIPFLLNNSETWDYIPQEAMDILQKVQNTFFCALMGTPIKGTPKPSLLWETGSLSIRMRIVEKKLNFYYHLKNLKKHSLASRILEIQEKCNFSGLSKECKELLDELSLSSINPENVKKSWWKNEVKKAANKRNKEVLLMDIKHYKKLDFYKLKEEEFETKNYIKTLNVSDARLRFRMRVNLVPNFKFCYKSVPAFRQSLWECPMCITKGTYHLDNLAHAYTCPMLKDLQNRPLVTDKDFVIYIRDVLRRREEFSENSNISQG